MDQAKSQAPSYAGHIHRDVTRRDGDLTITLEFEARFLRRKRMATDCGWRLWWILPKRFRLMRVMPSCWMMGARLLSRPRPSRWWKYAIKILQKLPWHIGNRHTPCEIRQDCLVIRRDHVLEDLLIRLGTTLAKTEAPFNPEGGAYGVGRTHGHSH
jgi:urease accessory protein